MPEGRRVSVRTPSSGAGREVLPRWRGGGGAAALSKAALPQRVSRWRRVIELSAFCETSDGESGAWARNDIIKQAFMPDDPWR